MAEERMPGRRRGGRRSRSTRGTALALMVALALVAACGGQVDDATAEPELTSQQLCDALVGGLGEGTGTPGQESSLGPSCHVALGPGHNVQVQMFTSPDRAREHWLLAPANPQRRAEERDDQFFAPNSGLGEDSFDHWTVLRDDGRDVEARTDLLRGVFIAWAQTRTESDETGARPGGARDQTRDLAARVDAILAGLGAGDSN